MLSTTAEYALRAAASMAVAEQPWPTRRYISSAAKVPDAYLVKVLKALEAAGLVETKRGPGGGYRLCRDPDDITAYDIIASVSELPRIDRCPLGLQEHVRLCPLHSRLDAVARMAEEAYRQSKLSELIPDRSKRSTCHFPRHNDESRKR